MFFGILKMALDDPKYDRPRVFSFILFLIYQCVCVCVLRVRVEVKVDSWYLGLCGRFFCSKLWRPRPPNLPHHHPLPSSRLRLLSLTNPVFSNSIEIQQVKINYSTYNVQQKTYLLILFFHCELFLFHLLQLITEVEFGSLLLQLGEFVLIFRDFAQRGLNTAFKLSSRLYHWLFLWSFGWLKAIRNQFNLDQKGLTICLGGR